MNVAELQARAPHYGLTIRPVAPPPVVRPLFHGPFGPLLAAVFAFRDRGQYILDDVDSAGTLWEGDARAYGVIRRMVLKKRQWSNCRPLYGWVPDGLFFPNLGRANFQRLDAVVPLRRFAERRGMSVVDFIRTTSSTHGCWCLYGPDRAIVGTRFDDVASAYSALVAKGRDALRHSIVDPADLGRALQRYDAIVAPPAQCQSLNDVSWAVLQRYATFHLGRKIDVQSAFHGLFAAEPALLGRFRGGDPALLQAYNLAAAIQGSHPLGESDVPYYVVDAATGTRDFSSPPRVRAATERIIPKILVLEAVEDQLFPDGVIESRSILAREVAARLLSTGGTQVFYRSNWIEALASCRVRVRVPAAFRRLVPSDELPLNELAAAMLRAEEQAAALLGSIAGRQAAGEDVPLDEVWDAWLVDETMRDLRFSAYGVLFWAVAGDEWLDQIAVVECRRFVEEASGSAGAA